MSQQTCAYDKCRRCDIGYLIAPYMNALIQSMSIQVKYYFLKNVASKCLNTAVSMFFLFFGKNALKHTIYCDVHNLQERHKNKVDNNSLIAAKLRDDILRKTKSRYIYYCMNSDGVLLKPDGSTNFFVGHVYVIEKVPENGVMVYYLYQSYIDQYTYSEYVERYKSIKVSAEKMAYYMDKINDMVNKKVWDADFVEFWKDFTKVDSSNLLGGVPQDAFFICYQRLKYDNCRKNLRDFVDKTLRLIPRGRDEEIFGASENFDESTNPLTNEEMRAAMSELKSRLDSDANASGNTNWNANANANMSASRANVQSRKHM